MKTNKLAIGGIIFLAMFFFAGKILAQEAENSIPDQAQNIQTADTPDEIENLDLSQMRAVAVINAGSIKINDKGSNNFEISFDLMNQEGIQPQVRYAIGLLQKNDNGDAVIDRKTYDEVLDIGSGEIVHKTVSYQAPSYLSGKYTLLLEAENSSGLRLAYVQGGEINLSGESPIEIRDGSCNIFFGENQLSSENFKNISQDDVKNPSFRCKVKNISENEIGAYLKTDIYEKSYLGKISATKKSDEVKLTSGEEKEFKVSLGGIGEMKNPLLAAAMFSKNEKQISKAFFYPYPGGGESFFYNIRLDKDYYLKNEIAGITADLRPIYSKDSILSYSITEENGMSCLEGKNEEENLNDTGAMELQVKIIRNCFNPTLTVSIKDKSGKVLGEEKYAIESRSQESKDARNKITQFSKSSKRTQIAILLVLGLVILGRLGFSIFNKVKYKNFKFPLFLFFLGAGFWMFSSEVGAATYIRTDVTGTYKGSTYGNEFTIILNDNVPPREGNTTYYFPEDGTLDYSASVERRVLQGACHFVSLGTVHPDCNMALLNTAVNKNYTVDISKTTNSNLNALYELNSTVMNKTINGGAYLFDTIALVGFPATISGSTSHNRDSCLSSNGYSDTFKSFYLTWKVVISGAGVNEFLRDRGASDYFYIKEKGHCRIPPNNPSKWHDGYYIKDALPRCYFGNPTNINTSQCSTTGVVTWDCKDAGFGGAYTEINCSDIKTPGACGSAAGSIPALTITKPAIGDLCLYGATPSDPFITSGNWYWTCGEDVCEVDCTVPVGCLSDASNLKYFPVDTPPVIGQLCGGSGVTMSGLALDAVNKKWTWVCNGPGWTRNCEAGSIDVDLKINGVSSVSILAGSSPTFSWGPTSSSAALDDCRACSSVVPPAVIDWRTDANAYSNYDTCKDSANTLYYGTKPISSLGVQYLHNSAGSITYGLICKKRGTGIHLGSRYYTSAEATLTVQSPVTCGSAKGAETCDKPDSNLCTDGSVVSVTDNGSYFSWDCPNESSCTASKVCPTEPSCGTAISEEYCTLTKSSLNLCSAGSVSNFNSSEAKFSWDCTNGGVTSCSARKHCLADDIWREIEP